MTAKDGPLGWLRRVFSGDPNDPDYRSTLLTPQANALRRSRAQFCFAVDELPTSEAEHRLADERKTINSTNLGGYLFREMGGSQIARCEADGRTTFGMLAAGAAGVYRPDSRDILTLNILPQGEQLMTAAHEYRHGWQDYHLGVGNRFNLTPTDFAAQTMMVEADARAFSTAVAWQMREAGNPSMWQAHLDAPAERHQAAAFEARMEHIRETQGPEAAQGDAAISAAMRDAYDVWFKTEDNYGPYVGQISVLLGNNAQPWSGSERLNSEFGPMVGRLPGRTVAEASYLGRGAVAEARAAAIMQVPALSGGPATDTTRSPTDNMQPEGQVPGEPGRQRTIVERVLGLH